MQAVRPTQAAQPLSELVGEYNVNTWIDGVLTDLVHARASDVHLNMSGVDKTLKVFARRDGELELVTTVYAKDGSREIVNKLKTASQLATSSNIVPEDGKYELMIDGLEYRVRAVALPTFDRGEKIVLRLPSVGEMKLIEQLGFSNRNLTAVRELFAKPGGLTLIAGPMGEGKTTTAHAAIFDVGVNGKAVIAVEDPVERVLPGVSQIEVNENVGAGFQQVMRFLVRADFDTLFIGEIRDAITAGAAVRMAKAGRRVIATIHATDNVTAILRLIELAEDSPLSVLDAVHGVISQRLVKRLNTEGGYTGRAPVHEVLQVNDSLTDHFIANSSLTDIRNAATSSSTSFAEDLRDLINAGITDQAEARRVIGHDA